MAQHKKPAAAAFSSRRLQQNALARSLRLLLNFPFALAPI